MTQKEMFEFDKLLNEIVESKKGAFQLADLHKNSNPLQESYYRGTGNTLEQVETKLRHWRFVHTS